MGRMIRRATALVLVWMLFGFPGLPLVLAQSALAAPEQKAAPVPSPSQPGTSVPAGNTATPVEAPPANADQSEKATGQEELPNAPSASQTPATAEATQPSAAIQEIPSGTAAATTGSPKGALASKPAGAAIAPSQQRRGRSLLIKTGLILGAAAALGSVFALSHGSPARPPGAQ